MNEVVINQGNSTLLKTLDNELYIIEGVNNEQQYVKENILLYTLIA